MKVPNSIKTNTGQFVGALLLLCAFSISLSIIRVLIVKDTQFIFMVWNLFLAWIPLIFAWLLYKRTSKNGLVWSKLNALLFAVWLLFLPNAFYLFTDFIHLNDTGTVEFMFDIVLFSVYSVSGLMLGYTALALVHIRALQRFGRAGHLLAVGALLASGFAIYLGRYLRWNSWDVIFSPFGLLFDLSERVANPIEHSLTFATTTLFFAFLGLVYLVVWRAIYLFKKP